MGGRPAHDELIPSRPTQTPVRRVRWPFPFPRPTRSSSWVDVFRGLLRGVLLARPKVTTCQRSPHHGHPQRAPSRSLRPLTSRLISVQPVLGSELQSFQQLCGAPAAFFCARAQVAWRGVACGVACFGPLNPLGPSGNVCNSAGAPQKQSLFPFSPWSASGRPIERRVPQGTGAGGTPRS